MHQISLSVINWARDYDKIESLHEKLDTEINKQQTKIVI